MSNFSQMNGCECPPTHRKRRLHFGGGFFLSFAATWLVLVPLSFAQTLKLGPFEMFIGARGVVGYDSNVDGVYPEAEVAGKQKGDFYWMPGLTFRSQSVAMSPRTTFNLSAALDYQDYLARNDLDTELYNAILNFQTVHPRLTLGGLASIDYSIEGIEDQYVPGSASRDPILTRAVNLFANWNYRKLRLVTSADYSIELHQYEQYQDGDQDETTLSAAAYLDLFSWGSLFYSWDNTVTTLIQTEEKTTETTTELGLTGAIPIDLIRRPKITYSLGYAYNETQSDSAEPEKTWEPTHTITVSDEFQLSKTIRLAGNATWESTVTDSEISFVYNVLLEQLLGARAQHALTFTQEPQPTFGSTTDTKTTTYGYNFGIKDLLIYNLSFGAGATYEESTPLGDPVAEMEKTTTVDCNLTHTRQLSRKLSRIITYVYTWENSNFHFDGPNQKHMMTYGFTYDF